MNQPNLPAETCSVRFAKASSTFLAALLAGAGLFVLLGSPPALAQGPAATGAGGVEERLSAIELQLARMEARLARLEGGTPTGPQQDAGTAATALPGRMEALGQRLAMAERRQRPAGGDPRESNATTLANAGGGGFSLRSADGSFNLRFRGLIHADGRLVQDGLGQSGGDTFFLNRVRPSLEGTLYKNFGFRILPDFGRGQFTLLESYLDVPLSPWLKMRAGKFKGPVGLERLQGVADLIFLERALPTSLVPNRDLGIELYGEPGGGVFTYQAGLFNGAPDGQSSDGDTDSGKEFEGRLFAHPFRAMSIGPLQGLGVGLSGTAGNKEGSSASSGLGSYKTSAQQTFFRYRSGGAEEGVVADGAHHRVSPQGYYYWGPLGLLGEYVLSTQEVRRGALRGTMNHASWQVAASYVLTGEKASFRSVTPVHAFDRSQGHWGALEIAARYSELRIDPDAFPVFADSQSSVRGAKAWTLGLNWHLTRGTRFAFNYEQTRFVEAAGGARKKDERTFMQRFQVNF